VCACCLQVWLADAFLAAALGASLEFVYYSHVISLKHVGDTLNLKIMRQGQVRWFVSRVGSAMHMLLACNCGVWDVCPVLWRCAPCSAFEVLPVSSGTMNALTTAM
jgi:hypothetical protein